jgi:hypothetical protein
MRSFPAIIVLADISGYTKFVVMHRSSLIHAEQIVTELMETVTRNATSPLTIQKLEGDAAFMSAEIKGDPAKAIDDVMRQVVKFMELYAAKQQSLFGNSIGGCGCGACQGIENLKLKCVVHAGDVLEKQVGTHTELAGEPVIVAHRLMKNAVKSDTYILATKAITKTLSVDPYPDHRTYVETITDVGDVETTAYFPNPLDLDRGGVEPFTRGRGRMEGLRLLIGLVLTRLRKGRRKFQHLPD